MDSIYLIDVSALAYRSFFAFINNPLKNSKGQETSAIFGFASHTLRLVKECQPSHIAFVKDLPKKTFRHALYTEYKAHRKPMPDALQSQLPIIDEFVAKSGLRTVALEGYEADDVMATLALRARARGMHAYIVTRDKDMMQLVDDSIFLFDLGKNGEGSLVTGAKEVKEKMGVMPARIVDYLSLIGDASDNVPGVAKIGPKTAVDLLETYGTLAAIYKNVENISKKGLRENLKADRENAFLSQKLVTLETDLTLPLGLDDLRYQGLDSSAVSAFLQEWELRSLLKMLPAAGAPAAPKAVTTARAVTVTTLGETAPAYAPAQGNESGTGGSSVTSPSEVTGNPKDSQADAAGSDALGSAPSGSGDDGDSASDVESGVDSASDSGTSNSDADLRYELVDSEAALETLRQRLSQAPILAVDTETTDLDTKVAQLVGLCLSTEEKTGYYLPVAHREGRNLPLPAIVKVLKPIFDDPQRLLVFHNAKYDLPVLERHGLGPAGLGPAGLDKPGKLADTMVAAYLANPGERELSLDALSLRHFGHEMIPIEALIGKAKPRKSSTGSAAATGSDAAAASAGAVGPAGVAGPVAKGSPGEAAAKGQKSFAEVPIADACRYGAEDADITFRLWKLYEKDLAEKELTRLFFDMEMALLPVLVAMEGKGIALDLEALRGIADQLKAEIGRLETEIHALADGPFNINSPTQLQEILFGKLGLKPGKKTKTGYSTDADVLQKLEGDHEIVAKLLDYRESTKLLSTYVEALPTMVHPLTHRVHTHYSQVIAATGRLSSINPNLQNIPIRTAMGREIRKCFTASAPGRLLLCADYSQIELRLLAHLSGDPALREAYRNNLDIHARTAAALYGVAEDQVTSDMRRSAKVVNFGVLYGMGAQRLAAQLRIPRAEASRFIDNYFSTYAMVDVYIRETVDKGRRLGYVETLSGRRRYLPDLMSDNRMFKENAERIAANTPIQGSAADLIKIAMIRIGKKLSEGRLDCDMLLQVHDELVFDVAESDIAAAEALIKTEMEGAMRLEVPLLVSLGTGPNWLEAHS